MAPKGSFFAIWMALLALIFSACTPTPAVLPTTDQNAVKTSVAGTQTALASAKPASSTSTVQPTQPEPTSIPASPTSAASATPAPSPTHQAVTRPPLIAYLKDGDVYLWREASGSVGVTNTQDAINLKISGDGELIAYLRQNPHDTNAQELWVVNTTPPVEPHVVISTDELSVLKSDPQSPDYGIGINAFTWLPGTHALVYGTYILHDGPGYNPNHDVRMVNADTLVKTTLLESGQGGLFTLSPDGNQLALSTPESISLVNMDGTHLRRDVLTFPAVITYSEYQYHPDPIWAADSKSLRVTIPPEDPIVTPRQPTALWLIRADGSSSKLSEIYTTPFAWPDDAFAPNLEHVAYAMPVDDPSSNQRMLRIANPDGSNDSAYDRGESLEFDGWSPDSEHFIYIIYQDPNAGIYLGNLNGQPTLINADPRHLQNIQWLDAKQFACSLVNGDQWELHILSMDGVDVAFKDTASKDPVIFDVLP